MGQWLSRLRDGSRDGLFDAPMALNEPRLKRADIDSCQFGNLWNRQQSSVRKRPSPIARSISRLLCVRRPSTILWCVVTRVVDAVDGVFGRRAWSHVGQKCREIVLPLVADCDALCSVVWIALVGRDETPSFHRRPRGPRAATAIFRVTMCRMASSGDVFYATAARYFSAAAVWIDHVCGANIFHGAAVTLHRNALVFAVVGQNSGHNQMTESLSNRRHIELMPLYLMGVAIGAR